jgi:hypothetical protein
MSAELTMGNYVVRCYPTFSQSAPARYTVKAAYDVSESGWLLFKDTEHKTVARFRDNVVIMSERV